MCTPFIYMCTNLGSLLDENVMDACSLHMPNDTKSIYYACMCGPFLYRDRLSLEPIGLQFGQSV